MFGLYKTCHTRIIISRENCIIHKYKDSNTNKNKHVTLTKIIKDFSMGLKRKGP